MSFSITSDELLQMHLNTINALLSNPNVISHFDPESDDFAHKIAQIFVIGSQVVDSKIMDMADSLEGLS